MKKLYLTILGSAIAYFYIDFQKQKEDYIARYAAGESLFEKTHIKK